jgi:hypothetical protein
VPEKLAKAFILTFKIHSPYIPESSIRRFVAALPDRAEIMKDDPAEGEADRQGADTLMR